MSCKESVDIKNTDGHDLLVGFRGVVLPGAAGFNGIGRVRVKVRVRRAVAGTGVRAGRVLEVEKEVVIPLWVRGVGRGMSGRHLACQQRCLAKSTTLSPVTLSAIDNEIQASEITNAANSRAADVC